MRSSLLLLIVSMLFLSVGSSWAHERDLQHAGKAPLEDTVSTISQASMSKSSEGWPGMHYEITSSSRIPVDRSRSTSPVGPVEGTNPPCTSGFVAIDLLDQPANEYRWGNDVLVSMPGPYSWNPRAASREDGTLYVVHEKDNDELLLYLSTNYGQSWIPWTIIVEDPFFLSHPTIAVGEGDQDILMVAYEVDQLDDYHIHMFWRDLNSTAQGVECIDVGGQLDLMWPRLDVDSPDYDAWYAYITYTAHDLSTGLDHLMFQRSTNFGRDWIAKQDLEQGEGMSWPDIDFGGNNTLWIAYSTEFNNLGRVFVKRSFDYGDNWDLSEQIPNVVNDQSDPRIACSRFGDEVMVAYEAWWTTDVQRWDINLVYSMNGGIDWEWSHLPYTYDDERFVEIIWSGRAGYTEWFHAVYFRRHGSPSSDVIYTAAPKRDLSPLGWKAETVVNSGGPRS